MKRITFPSGVYYVSRQRDIASTLFNRGGTASGFFRKYSNRVVFFNPSGAPEFALICNRVTRPSESPFYVSCSRQGDGRTRYMHGMDSLTEARLGLQSFRGSMEHAADTWDKINQPS